MLPSIFDSACVPSDLCASKLVPVPKARAPAALLERDAHRGISVSQLFSRSLERLMNTRLESVVSGLSLRSPTQCGFRPGHGTLDAIFTMQHLIHSAQHDRRLLYVVFVDFKKAFDKVRRDLLLERCRELGIHGEFLAVLVALYDQVYCCVAVNGALGEPVRTTTGTKQGSELSPLLFGLFIEVLHDLIKLKLPGAGPVLGSLRVPDIMYADDVALVSSDPAEAQQLLDVLDVFCRLFDMEVNLAPHKTCVVVFRRPRAHVPRGFRLSYRGREVARQKQYTYLGALLHETNGLSGAADALAAAGSKAMHALLTRCRRTNLTQFDMKSRLFDALVEPVLSYASHIWGPLTFKQLRASPFNPKSEKVHTAYLRIMAGAGKSTSLDVIYRDFHRLPIMYHWVVLAVRWWNKMSQAQQGGPSMAGCAWVEDVKLAVAGCATCWSSHVLRTMCSLGLLDHGWRQQPLEGLLALSWEEPTVQHALNSFFRSRWQGPFHDDPRLAPTKGVAMCHSAKWVLPVDPATDHYDRASAPAHTRLCLPFARLRNLAQLRLGCAHLEVEQGRKCRPKIPRHDRLCKLCSAGSATPAHRVTVLNRTGTNRNVEDLKHFLLECPAYDDLRAACPAFPSDVYATLSAPGCVAAVMGHADQAGLANTLFVMKTRRSVLLGLPVGMI